MFFSINVIVFTAEEITIMNESNAIGTSTHMTKLVFGAGNIPGRLDMTTGHYQDHESWLGYVEKKYGRLFAQRVGEVLLPPCDDDDIQAFARQAVLDQVIYEFKPLLSQEAVRDHIMWNYEASIGPMVEMFTKVFWKKCPEGSTLYYTPEAALQLINHLTCETGSLIKRERNGKYCSLYEFNPTFDNQQKT